MRSGQSNNMEEDESEFIVVKTINKNVTESSLLASRKCEEKLMVANLPTTINLERLIKTKQNATFFFILWNWTCHLLL